MRNIEDILFFRSDISPFLVHLTRDNSTLKSARKVLKKILQQQQLVSGITPVSDARFGMYTDNLGDETKRLLFSAICFTETPISEVHCLLDIAYRNIELKAYGIVFLKERLS